MEGINKYCICTGKAARERYNGLLHDEKRGRNFAVGTFQRSSELLEEELL